MKTYIAIASLLLLFSCASYKAVMPSQADVNRVSAKYPDLTLAQLNEGKTLYETHCGKCHGLKKPSDLNENQWSNIVPKMVAKVNKKGDLITKEGQEHILQYLVTMGSK